MTIGTASRLAIVFLITTFLMANAWSRTYEVHPGQDYRPLLHELKPGDEMVFLPGIHEQHAKLDIVGTAESPIVIRGETDANGEVAEIRWTERGQNTWTVSGQHLKIRDLAFHSAHHYGMRIGMGEHITIEHCLFRENGGGDLSANSGPVMSLYVLRSRFIGGKRTPVYIGSHDGKLVVEDFRFDGNVVDGSQIDHSGVVGYGIQLKLNVDGVIRNNYISGTQGPGIMVYGFENPNTEHRQIVESNIVVGARNSANIVVGGGLAVIRDNLVLAGQRGGIVVIDYGGRDLLDNVTVRNNVAAANEGSSLRVHRKARNPVVTSNRAYTAADKPSIGNVSESNTTSENEAVAVEPSLLVAIQQLRGRLPSSESAREAIETLETGRRSTQDGLAELLGRLLEPR